MLRVLKSKHFQIHPENQERLFCAHSSVPWSAKHGGQRQLWVTRPTLSFALILSEFLRGFQTVVSSVRLLFRPFNLGSNDQGETGNKNVGISSYPVIILGNRGRFTQGIP